MAALPIGLPSRPVLVVATQRSVQRVLSCSAQIARPDGPMPPRRPVAVSLPSTSGRSRPLRVASDDEGGRGSGTVMRVQSLAGVSPVGRAPSSANSANSAAPVAPRPLGGGVQGGGSDVTARSAQAAMSAQLGAPPARPQPQQSQQEEASLQLPLLPTVPQLVIDEFEHKLEADLQTVAVTITAILGVIVFWRGVWSLLDHFIGDSVLGDLCCIVVGLSIVLYIRLAGLKIASFWPPS